ncbi:hypothetical protein [Castellaniella sp.]|uniref:hypothetical protein n=1 Tax=Castellaniella sp. TaxID=1955812 RepID=UPI002B003469|nr:hypothetical protein [Castellaniella sp.]
MSDINRQNPIIKALQDAMSQDAFPTIESAQTCAETFFIEHNRRAVDDFHGLSPEQMSQILYAPFDSPALVAFQDKVPLSACSQTPLVWLFLRLRDAMGDDGLKPTAKGNLPRAVCRTLAEDYRSTFHEDDDGWYGPVSTETDFIELHIVHVLATLAGFVRKYKGRLIISQKCRKLLKNNDGDGLYPALLECYIRQFNWAYWDRYPDLPFAQQSFLFTVYLLEKYGKDERPVDFYAKAFLRAFPMLQSQLPEEGRYTRPPEETATHLYIHRCLRRFATFTGLATLRFRPNPDKTDYLNRHLISILSTPLLHACWRFS